MEGDREKEGEEEDENVVQKTVFNPFLNQIPPCPLWYLPVTREFENGILIKQV